MRTAVWIGILALLVGLWSMQSGYFLGDAASKNYSPLLSYFLTNFGGLLVFTTAYTFIQEFFLKKEFSREIQGRIDEKLKSIELDTSIRNSGLVEVHERFTDEKLLQRLTSAKSVKMVVMRNNSFFRAYHGELRTRIIEGKLSLDIVLPNPRNLQLTEQLYTRFSDQKSGKDLARSIGNSFDTWLRGGIWERLETENQKTRLKVYLSDKYPLYSAYIFDENELWYIPYHHRRDWRPIPVFVFLGQIRRLEIFADIQDLLAVQPHDMGQALANQR